jgi:hypothetical protein
MRPRRGGGDDALCFGGAAQRCAWLAEPLCIVHSCSFDVYRNLYTTTARLTFPPPPELDDRSLLAAPPPPPKKKAPESRSL